MFANYNQVISNSNQNCQFFNELQGFLLTGFLTSPLVSLLKSLMKPCGGCHIFFPKRCAPTEGITFITTNLYYVKLTSTVILHLHCCYQF